VKRSASVLSALLLAGLVYGVAVAQTQTNLEADELYRQRETLSSAVRAASLWSERSTVDFEAAWKLARACYWLGTHAASQDRRAALDRGVTAGENAIRLAGNRPEGHFWLAANMGRLAETFGLMQALKYRGRIKDELEKALLVNPEWQAGSADDALGQWYATVPRLFGGSSQKAEQHLRSALQRDPNNLSALSFFGEMLINQGRAAEARDYLQRVVEAGADPEWEPENREFKRKAAELLKTIQK
jgi:tetratricopeptide (TPR) repeat protein